ncbi:hypothetical protein [Niallia nealsonii]|uniref:Uncharacterized protein n=1 Tax=Niallia nealsonii TaxID=115979 RepID=A0A2N0YWK1_9BACI|nr:hypothetical protein [Niallia nealsonii]PKG21638.1 hypothetical protein CWS01_21360 [Niallia nealsonii]
MRTSFFITIIVFGGFGYFVYNNLHNKKTNNELEFAKKADVEESTINKEDKIEVRTEVSLNKVWEYYFDKSIDESTKYFCFG